MNMTSDFATLKRKMFPANNRRKSLSLKVVAGVSKSSRKYSTEAKPNVRAPMTDKSSPTAAFSI